MPKWGLSISAFGLLLLLASLIGADDKFWRPVTEVVPGGRLTLEDTFYVLRGGTYWIEFDAPTVNKKNESDVACNIDIEIGGKPNAFHQELHYAKYFGAVGSVRKQIYMATTDETHENIEVPLALGQHSIKLTTLGCDALNWRGATILLRVSGDPTWLVILTQLLLTLGTSFVCSGLLLFVTAFILKFVRRLKTP